MPEYVIAFEISRQYSSPPFGLLGLLSLLAGIIILFGKLRLKWRRPAWPLPCFLCVFGVLWFWVVSVSVRNEESRAQAALAAFQSGRYSVVDGVVTEFHPMPYNGHDSECFSVRSERFCYSDYIASPGFHNAASHGGPIRPGLSVRVTYLGPTILRLEIAKDQMSTLADSKIAEKAARVQSQKEHENNPTSQALETAFDFTAVGVTLLWNIYWRWTIGFWLRPPYRPVIKYAFRTFFALNLAGSLFGLVNQLGRHPLTSQNVGPTLAVAASMYLVVGVLHAGAWWVRNRCDRTAAAQADNARC
ncbi:hypothetical protein [uncultured Paludibaculum sp.]|uniref:hypothetical protein n=1 Tax=uncultured Paludibaculum sp. TaxID=1765020 RepID=UPI002AAB0A77|nr:hypothetical protein [uncultured Paludibaculum sp.]